MPQDGLADSESEDETALEISRERDVPLIFY